LFTCRGDRILTIDADLQDPPELLGDMWRLMERAEADVVYGLRRERPGETMLKRGTAALFYRLMRRGWLRRHAGRQRRFPSDDAPRARHSQQHAGAASFHSRHGELDRAAPGAARL
jgi:glycosyltransferase involved in cell wall biosynthesis